MWKDDFQEEKGGQPEWWVPKIPLYKTFKKIAE